MTFRIVLFALLLPSTAIAQTPGRAAVIAAATDIIQKARYCTFITIGEDGQPQARMVDPIAPDGHFTIWFATNPLTRKVEQVRRNPKVTLSCFDSSSSSYVTVLGRGHLVTEAAEKQRHWKSDWAAIYPNGVKGDDFMLIRITPVRLEIVSENRGMVGDPKTWLPPAIEFPSTQELEVMAINAAKQVSVSDLDTSLLAKPFADWLDALVGSQARSAWEANDCGEHSGSPQPARDHPICSEVEVFLSGGRRLLVTISVGTMGTGISANPPQVRSVVIIEANGETDLVRKLSDLPARLQDSSGVETAARSFIVAFNNLDMPAFLNCFADDATVFHPPAVPPRTFPTRVQGRREIERTFQVLFDLMRAGSGKSGPPYQDLQPRDLLIQQFDDSAVLTFHLGTAARTSRRTFVFRRTGSEWKIVHLHASSFDVAQ